jgi:hypothetical protein
MKLDEMKIIDEYNNGKSMNAIAEELSIYTMTVKRILEKHDIELRHDGKKKGSLYVKDGEKLIEWAKAQGRLVTKQELAKQLGRARLSPSYFIKYPELGQYVVSSEQAEFREYYSELYVWLQRHGIPYKTNDKSTIGAKIDVLLLGDYSGIIMQLAERPKNVSTRVFKERLRRCYYEADRLGFKVVELRKEHFEKALDGLKETLDELKK